MCCQTKAMSVDCSVFFAIVGVVVVVVVVVVVAVVAVVVVVVVVVVAGGGIDAGICAVATSATGTTITAPDALVAPVAIPIGFRAAASANKQMCDGTREGVCALLLIVLFTASG